VLYQLSYLAAAFRVTEGAQVLRKLGRSRHTWQPEGATHKKKDVRAGVTAPANVLSIRDYACATLRASNAVPGSV
jgi:hypothetical protein